MNPVERLVHECEASGVARRLVLLRARPGVATLEQAEAQLLGSLGRQARAHRHTLTPELIAVWWQDADQAWPHALPPGLRAETFVLPHDADALLEALPPPPDAEPPPRRGVPLDDAALRVMERGLMGADVSRFVRRAPVLRISATDGPPRVVWEKRFLHLPELTDTLAPGRDALACRTRLRVLCRTLDARMLRHLSNLPELAGTGPFALNLNVGSLRAAEFARFAAMLPARLRGRVVLMLSPHDVVADPAAFLSARDSAREAGFRIMLRGVTATLLPALTLPRLGVDYVGLRWSQTLGRVPLLPAGPEVVLAGVDGPAALRWAARSGITLFAGSLPPRTPAAVTGRGEVRSLIPTAWTPTRLPSPSRA